MFHVEHRERVRSLAAEFKVELATQQLDQFEVFAGWLTTEALAAGGIGPHELKHLWDRHILDSLCYLVASVEAPSTALDVGSGVGLPGIPLALCLPETLFTLLDRSGRRIRLLKRAVRVLGLANVVVEQAEIEDVTDRSELVVSRASLPPTTLLPHLHRVVSPSGEAVVGGSTIAPVSVAGYETCEIHSTYLDRSRWMLIMHPS